MGGLRQWAAAPIVWIVGAVVALGVWNTSRYPASLGFDGQQDMSYADGLLHGRLPHHTGEYHMPPGFYALAAVVDRVAAAIPHFGDPHRATQALDVALLAATLVVIWRIALELWPDRPRRALVATLFAAFVPVTERTAAMFHPETLELFLSTVAIWLALRLLRRRESLRLAIAVGVALGLAQLVRDFSIGVLGAVLLVLLLYRRWKPAVVVAAIALAIPMPWYVRQTVVYGTPLPFNRPTPQTAIWRRRRLDFYIGLGGTQAFTEPYRGHFVNEAIPTTYSELWGDYFGHWAWNADHPIPPGALRVLRRQAWLGLLPTLLAVAGWLMLLRGVRRDPGRLLVALIPPFGLAEYAFLTIAHPSPDGDVLKASYLLVTTVGWAVGFAYGLTRLPRTVLFVTAAILIALAIIDVPFLVYG